MRPNLILCETVNSVVVVRPFAYDDLKFIVSTVGTNTDWQRKEHTHNDFHGYRAAFSAPLIRVAHVVKPRDDWGEHAEDECVNIGPHVLGSLLRIDL